MKIKLLVVATSAILGSSCALASSVLPTGGKVLHGNAQIFESNNGSMFISSMNDKNVISWMTFNVGKEHSISFDNKAYLNLVRGSSASVIEGSIYSNKGGRFYLVNPNAVTRISDLSKAKSGDFIRGKIEDIQVLQVNKTSDLQITQSAIQSIEGRLSYAFLLNSAVQRNAERVTAEEIRYVANELEDTVGSIYSILSQELQLPLVKRFMLQMTREGYIPDLPQGSQGVEPLITTGIEALGRGHDLTKLDTFIRYAQVFPEAFQTRVKQGAILSQIATALGIDSSSVVKSEEEYQQEMMAAQQAQMEQQVAPQVANGMMGG